MANTGLPIKYLQYKEVKYIGRFYQESKVTVSYFGSVKCHYSNLYHALRLKFLNARRKRKMDIYQLNIHFQRFLKDLYLLLVYESAQVV